MSRDEATRSEDRRTGAAGISRRQWLKGAGALAVVGGVGATSLGTSAASALEPDVHRVEVDDQWKTVELERTYGNPVAFALTPSYEGGNDSTTRLRDVTGSSFDVAVEEWGYHDGWHTMETLGAMVLDAGSYALDDGRTVAVGRAETFSGWTSIQFQSTFETTPVLLTQVQSCEEETPIVTRNRDVSGGEFEVRVQEAASRDGSHATERVGYLAVPVGTGTMDGRPFEAGVQTANRDWTTIEFEGSYDQPVLLADVQSYYHSDTVGLRYRNLSGSSVELIVEAEESSDASDGNVSESIGYVVVEGAASSTSTAGYGAMAYGMARYGR